MRRAAGVVAGSSGPRRLAAASWPAPNPAYHFIRHAPVFPVSAAFHASPHRRQQPAPETRLARTDEHEGLPVPDMEEIAMSIPESLDFPARLRIAYRAFHHPKGAKRYDKVQDRRLEEVYTHPNPPPELAHLPRSSHDNSHLVQIGISAMRLEGWLHARSTGLGLSIEDMARSVDQLVSTANLHGIAMRLQWPLILHSSINERAASIRLMARTAAAMFGMVEVDRKNPAMRRTLLRQLALNPIQGARTFAPYTGNEDAVVEPPNALPDPLPPSPLVPPDIRPLSLGERSVLVRNVTTSHFAGPEQLKAFVEAITHSSKEKVTRKTQAPLDNRVMTRLGDAAMRLVLWEWMWLFHRDVPVETLAEEIEYRLRDEVLVELAEDMYWRQCLIFGAGFQSPHPSDLTLATSFTRSIFGAILVSRNFDRLISVMRMTGLLSDELHSAKGREAQAALADKGMPQGPNQRPRPCDTNFRWKPGKLSRSPGIEPVVVDYLDYGAASGHDQVLDPIIRPTFGDSGPPALSEDESVDTGADVEARGEDSEAAGSHRRKGPPNDAEQIEMLVAGRDEAGQPIVPEYWKPAAVQGPTGGYLRTIDQQLKEVNEKVGPEWMRPSRQQGIRQVLEWQRQRPHARQGYAPPLRADLPTKRKLLEQEAKKDREARSHGNEPATPPLGPASRALPRTSDTTHS